jgi:beta-glucosidase/6-phospho-beta-glucosidase/beta-galactosidase
MRASLPLTLFALSCAQITLPAEPPPGPPPEALVFPENFLWGTAIAGFQVDAGCPTIPASQCEDRNSDWFQWVTDPQLIAEPGNFLSGEALSGSPGHFELFAEDARLSEEELGANSLRMSIEWSRLFPEEPIGANSVDDLAAFANPEAVAHYHAVFAALRTHNLTPLVTLNHYTLPLWIHDGKACHQDPFACEDRGWLDRDRMLKEIALYAGFCAREFGGEVDLWATLNEPFAIVLAGYFFPTSDRTNPPGVSEPALAREVVFNLVEGHARMYDAVHAEDSQDADGDGQSAEVGLVANIAAIVPFSPGNANDELAAEHANYLYNLVFLEGAIRGKLDRDVDGIAEEERPDLAGRMDYLGINYYTKLRVLAGIPLFPDDFPLFDFLPIFDIEASFPDGIKQAIEIAKEYGLPMIITENGTSDVQNGDTISQFIVPHLEFLHQAIAEGAEVRGYFYWSLIDNYEWNHGLSELQFGLFDVDPADPLKQRRAKPSVAVYREIIENNALTSTLRARFGAQSKE